MSLTRTHIAFLGIISIFTGLIGPGTSSGNDLLSYLMTDMRWIAYGILIALILAFFLAAVRNWPLYRLSVFIVIIGICSLAVLTYLGHISNIKTGVVANGMDWGWIFLVIGTLLLAMSYRKGEYNDEESSFSHLVDTIIGMAGGFALACIAGILILSSLSFFNRATDHDILKRMFVSGEIDTLSGGIHAVTASESFPSISYDRGKDILITMTSTASGNLYKLIRDGQTETGILRDDLTPLLLGGNLYAVDRAGYAYSGGRLMLGSRISGGEKSIVYKNAGSIEILHQEGRNSLTYTGIMSMPITLSSDKNTLAWTESFRGGKRIIKNGTPLSGNYTKVEKIDISRSGQSIMGLVGSGGEMLIVKNESIIGKLPPSTISGSYISNGSYALFVTKEKDINRVHLDMQVISRDLSEVRETFLEKDGGSYAFFGRPIGEDRYCLFTRYKGNLCGLEGYMNPVLGADGGSILFAGKKDGVWSIYRNTDILVRNTGYAPKGSVDFDYAYFDTTNPRTYLFIERDETTGLYSYRKNGVLLPGTWKDVSTEITFGYDNHILTAAEDEKGWKILEL